MLLISHSRRWNSIYKKAYGFHGREFQSLTKEAFIIILDSY
ncbi:unnamed protein product [Brassica rapa subsp. trilocularis]